MCYPAANVQEEEYPITSSDHTLFDVGKDLPVLFPFYRLLAMAVAVAVAGNSCQDQVFLVVGAILRR